MTDKNRMDREGRQAAKQSQNQQRQEHERLAELFRKIEPDQHPDSAGREEEGRPWRSVDEYREAQRLKRELDDAFDDLDLDEEDPDP